LTRPGRAGPMLQIDILPDEALEHRQQRGDAAVEIEDLGARTCRRLKARSWWVSAAARSPRRGSGRFSAVAAAFPGNAAPENLAASADDGEQVVEVVRDPPARRPRLPASATSAAAPRCRAARLVSFRSLRSRMNPVRAGARDRIRVITISTGNSLPSLRRAVISSRRSMIRDSPVRRYRSRPDGAARAARPG